MLSELAGVTARPFLIIFERSQQSGEVPGIWRGGGEANVIPIFKKQDVGNVRLISLTSILGKVMVQIILSKLLQDKKVFGSS